MDQDQKKTYYTQELKKIGSVKELTQQGDPTSSEGIPGT